jgi:hypothetical protein
MLDIDLKDIAEQQQICSKYQSAFCPTLPDDMVAIALETIGQSPIYGVRVAQKTPTDNVEWFIYCGEHSDAADFYQPVHAQHLAEYLPSVQAYLALAPGYHFIIDDAGYEDVWLPVNG